MELAGAAGLVCGTTGTFLRIRAGMEVGGEERGVTVGWEASEGSHRGMFQLAGHVLLHCSLASIIHMYAHEACWEQTSDMHRFGKVHARQKGLES